MDNKCNNCKKHLFELLILTENIGKVYSVEGNDITYDFFNKFNLLRLEIRSSTED